MSAQFAYQLAKGYAISELKRRFNKNVRNYFNPPTPKTPLKSIRVRTQPDFPPNIPTFKSGSMARYTPKSRTPSRRRSYSRKRKFVSRKPSHPTRSYYRRKRGHTRKPGGNLLANAIHPKGSYKPDQLEKKIMTLMSPVYQRRQLATFPLQVYDDVLLEQKAQAVFIPMAGSLEIQPYLYDGRTHGTVTDAAYGDQSTTGFPGEFAPGTNQFLSRYHWKHRTMKLNMRNSPNCRGDVDIYLCVRRDFKTFASFSTREANWEDFAPRPDMSASYEYDTAQPVDWKNFKILKKITTSFGSGINASMNTAQTLRTVQLDIPVDRVIKCKSTASSYPMAQSANHWDDYQTFPQPFIVIVPRLYNGIDKVDNNQDNLSVEMFTTDTWTYLLREEV